MTNNRKLTYNELKDRSHTVDSLNMLEKLPVYAIIENVRSLLNVGAIFRTADALRLEKLILSGYTGRPPRKEIEKAALGAVESVNWEEYKTSIEAIENLREKNMPVIALEQTVNSTDFEEFEYEYPSVIILGNEYDGIMQETLDICDHCIHIPMLGVKQSLNVSTAFGVLGYEILKQYRSKFGIKE
ncbi:MAG: RNA methyltransferase [bacterium]|nr:RNA methyltransferase [bacterium]